MVTSHDLEDIINGIEGRQAIVEEVLVADIELRAYLVARFCALRQHPDFDNTLPGLVPHDELYQDRIETIRSRIATIAGLKGA